MGIGTDILKEAVLVEGYTQYWSHEGFEDDQWKKFTAEVKKIISAAKRDKIEIAGGDGRGKPQITDTYIMLNGKAPDDYETMRIEKGPEDFGFCKTAEKPYDAVVVSILAAAQKINKTFKPRSDGGPSAIKRIY